MVHVYNCHPFASQQIVQVGQEPGLVCCGGGALFVVATGGCKVESYSLEREGCPLICRFATMGTVKSIRHSTIGDYLVTIEEKNSATYLRAYTNWRYQAEEKSRVGVRLLGHLLRGASVWGGVQMEIIEIPLSERPVAVACCPITGDLLVGCENTLVLFTLRTQNQQNLSQQNLQSSWSNTQQNSSQGQTSSQHLSILDFERCVILHLPKMTPKQVALCGGYVAVQAELEVLVLKLETASELRTLEESSDTNKSAECLDEQIDFLLIPRHQELLGDRAKDCDLPVSIEKTGLEDRRQYSLSYVLFRRFSPEFFQGCSVEETQLHSLQLYPMYTSSQSASEEDPACVFCFFSLPTAGYLYSLKGGVEPLSTYQYPEKVLEAVVTDHLLHVITKSALQCFTVRCAAVAARVEDPYIDTTMRACPPSSLEVCALRMQLFIGLRSVCVYGRHVILLSTADTEPQEEPERSTQRRGLSRKWTMSSAKETSPVGHGWNIYVVDTVSPLTLYQEMDEYSQRYVETNPQAQSHRHLLSEAHLLLRASFLQLSRRRQNSIGGEAAALLQRDADGPPDKEASAETDRRELDEAFRHNCALLGDSFSRGTQKDCHLALPYYRMSGLSVTEIMSRNRPHPSSPHSFGPGFLFYLKHFLLEESDQTLSQEAADEIVHIFSQSEPSMLVSVCASPSMSRVSAGRTLQILQHLEDTAGVSVPMTIAMATMVLRLDDLPQYTQLMERHAEMMLVYGFIEEPRLLLHGGGGGQNTHVRPTALSHQLAKSQPGLLVAAMVALHENNKVQLEQADHIFKELSCANSLQVDFWEAMLMASSQDAVIQELLFRLSSVYIDRLTNSDAHSSLTHTAPRRRSLKSADDLINSCSHYGTLYPWLTLLSPAHTTSPQHQEALHKLQSLLCGPSLSVGSVVPLLERLSEETIWGFSLHLLCTTRKGQYGSSIEKLLDRCPQAIIAFANHQLQDKHMALWWQKLLPELCDRTRASPDNGILLAALKETLVVVAMEMSPAEFLELIPDDGTASYFLPHLLTCSQRHLLAN
ncbi:unnamed protein product [Ophioblennius macclurei]